MGNKITTIVTTFVLLVSFILLVAFITTDQQQDESEQLIQEFTETVRYKGYITYDQYINLINQIPYDNFKVRITHFVNNNNNIDDDYVPGVQNMRFTSQIIGSSTDQGYPFLNSGGTQIYSGTLLYNGSDTTCNNIYKMQVGDQIQVDLVVTETTFFESIVGAFTGVGSPSMKITASSSGVILNTKYNDLT